MRVLVTGAAGFLGRELVGVLAREGSCTIRCLVRPGHDTGGLAPDGAAIEFVRGNMTSRTDVEAAVQDVDVVYHLAAAMKGGAADMFLNTVVGSQRLLDALAARPATRVVLVSSLGVYGVAGLRRGALVDENTPLEPAPHKRDPYSYSKWRQEQLFFQQQQRSGFPLVVLRPGVIYGAGGGGPLSARVGVNVFGTFLSLGGGNALPLSHVRNCAEALAVAGNSPAAVGQVFNVCDDDLPSCRRYLREYCRNVRRLRVVPVPYWMMQIISRMVEGYHYRSRGQMPAAFTPYKTASLWKGNRFSNARLKSLGWKPRVSTADGMREAFAYWRSQEPAGQAAARR
jgi:nucleoside-diphosphate-sugar epimerase